MHKSTNVFSFGIRPLLVLSDDIRNVSDHLALRLYLHIQYSSYTSSQMNPNQVAWHKITKPEIQAKYTLPLEQSVQTLMDHHNLKPVQHWDEMLTFRGFDIDSLLSNLSQIMINMTDQCLM